MSPFRRRHGTRLDRLKTRFHEGRWAPTLAGEARAEAVALPTVTSLCLYLDVLHALRGVADGDATLVQELAQSGGINDSRVHWRLAAHRYRIDGDIEYALTYLHRQRPRRWWRASVGSRVHDYPTLLAALIADARTAPSRLTDTRHAVAANALLRRKATLPQVLAQHGAASQSPMRVAVIGNAPTALTTANGAAIDACDCVMRFNHTALTSANRAFIGATTHVWILSPATPLNDRPSGLKACMVAGVQPFDRPSGYWKHLTDLDVPLIGTFDASVWYSLVASLHAPPSAGLLALTEIDRLSLSAQVLTTGFTLDNEHTCSNHHGDRTPASGRHNWHGERELLARLCRPGKPETSVRAA